MIYLYVITNCVLNKIYVGQTNNPDQRWRAHKSLANAENPKWYVHRAMRKHNTSNFTFEVIAGCRTTEDADALETVLIEQYNCRTPNGYNMTGGGRSVRGINHPSYGIRVPKELAEKRTAHLKGKPKSEETKEKIRQTLTGKKHTAERRINISKAHIGQVAWNKGTKGICKPNSGSFKPRHNRHGS